MSYKPDRGSSEPTAGIPRAPRQCSVEGCTEDACVTFLVVLDGSREVCGSFGDFGVQNGEHISLRSGYTFVRWIGRCFPHYERDLYACGKGQWSHITGRNPRLTLEAWRDYWAKRDAEEAARGNVA